MNRPERAWVLAILLAASCEVPLIGAETPEISTGTGGASDDTGPDDGVGESSTSVPGTTVSVDDGPATGSSGSGDSATADGGSTTTGDPPPGLGCDRRDDLLLCEDFESGAIDPTRWYLHDEAGAELTVVDDMAAFGAHALRVDIPVANGASATLVTAAGTVLPLEVNHVFGRGFFHVTPDAPPSHSLLFFAEGEIGGTTVRYRLDSNNRRLNSRYVNPSLDIHGGLKKMSDYFLPADQWICIEWEYDGVLGEMRYWVDGESLDAAEVTQDEDPPWIAPVFESFEIGFKTFQPADVPTVVFWDEIALATSRIGCG